MIVFSLICAGTRSMRRWHSVSCGRAVRLVADGEIMNAVVIAVVVMLGLSLVTVGIVFGVQSPKALLPKAVA